MDFDEQIEAIEGGDEENIYNDIILDENPSNEYKTKKDAVIFLIECSNSMLENSFQHVFDIAENFLKTKIITNENDLFSFILYNTAIKNNILNFEGINILFSLSAPDAQLIKNLKILSQNSQEKYNQKCKEFLKDNFPLYEKKNLNNNNNVNNIIANDDESAATLNEALWICHCELKNLDQKDYNRRIFLFTDDDNPMSSACNKNKRQLSIQRAKDMLESEIVIELFPMNFSKTFDLRKFYCEIIPHDEHAQNNELVLTGDLAGNKLRELTKRIRQKEIKKRTIGSCMFYLSKDLKVSVNFFSTVRKTLKSRSYMIDARTNKGLTTVNQVLCNNTGKVLYPNQIGTFHEYGGKKIQFTREDMKKIKTFDAPGIKLMGFKSFDSIKPYYNIRESYFIYPNENMTVGASQLFDALIKQLIIKNKVAIVKFVPREGTNIRFCALLPQRESFDEDYFQTPPGFNLIFLPYAEELRSNKEIFQSIKQTGGKNINKNEKDENLHDFSSHENGKESKFKLKLTEEQTSATKKLIKKMSINFDSRNHENPSIQKFYSTLQAIALGEEAVEEVEDQLQPDKESLEKLNNIDVDFAEAFFDEIRDYSLNKNVIEDRKRAEKKRVNEIDIEIGMKKTNKMKKTTNTLTNEDISNIESLISESSNMENRKTHTKSKKLKKNEDGDFIDDDLLEKYEDGTISSLTIHELKEICQKKHLKFSSKFKKNDYIEVVKDFLIGLKDHRNDENNA